MEQTSIYDGFYEQRLGATRKSISILIEWVIFGVLSFITTYVTIYSYGEGSPEWVMALAYILSTTVGMFFLFLVIYTVDTVKDLKFIAWSDFRLRYLTRLEVFPDVGDTLQERVMNKVREIYPIIGHFRAQKGLRFDAQASMWVKDRWDIVVDLNAMERLDTPRLVLVKFIGPGEVGLGDIQKLGRTVRLVRVLKPLSTLEAVLVVSEAGFSTDAVHAVEWGKVPGLPKLGTRLILAKERGFKLES
jgi:hypothetical protein